MKTKYKGLRLREDRIDRVKAKYPDAGGTAQAVNALIDDHGAQTLIPYTGEVRTVTADDMITKMNQLKRISCMVGIDVIVKKLQSGEVDAGELTDGTRAELLEDGSIAVFYALDDTGYYTKQLLIPSDVFSDDGSVKPNQATITKH